MYGKRWAGVYYRHKQRKIKAAPGTVGSIIPVGRLVRISLIDDRQFLHGFVLNLSERDFGIFLTYIYLIMSEYSMGDAIKKFLEQSRLKGGMQAFQIEDAWEKIMGKTVARYTDKLQVINDTLFITTQVGPLKQELIFQKEKIIQRVNEALGQRIINKIVVQ